jgi:hypothetical protein
MLRALVLVALIAGCDDGAQNVSDDLSASMTDFGPDLLQECPGFDETTQSGPCSRVGPGWMGSFCYPNTFTYCACLGGTWSCCGDQSPACPATQPQPGEACCPGAGPDPALTCQYGPDGGSGGHCTCSAGLRWTCS